MWIRDKKLGNTATKNTTEMNTRCRTGHLIVKLAKSRPGKGKNPYKRENTKDYSRKAKSINN
jgi:hypothetical protein